jgi:formylglycine-generating enzyme required for sulfatase activity
VSGVVNAKVPLKLPVTLKETRAVNFGKKWTNSLSMEFTPLGDILISTAETRRGDYAEFLKHMVYSDLPQVPVDTDRNLPMTFVNRAEAQTFCRWLTQKERAKPLQLLDSTQSYRLPTDDEWSMAAGLPREKGGDPADRNGRIQGMYPWSGYDWPPNPPAGNFWDQSAAEAMHRKDGIPGYNDKFPTLAPVRSFGAHLDMYDMAGNVWEWVQEDMGGPNPTLQRLGVLRGGSWRTKDRNEMLASFRRPVPAGMRENDVGFRIVLSVEGSRARAEE